MAAGQTAPLRRSNASGKPQPPCSFPSARHRQPTLRASFVGNTGMGSIGGRSGALQETTFRRAAHGAMRRICAATACLGSFSAMP
jgi:hypothetical protein